MSDMTQSELKKLLHYDPNTGVFTWRKRDASLFKRASDCKSWNKRFSGNRAGCVAPTKGGYTNRQISIRGKLYREHRLAWLYMTGSAAPDEIDHINRNATDNRWTNLRAANNGLNHRNMSMKRSNTSGVTGVCFDASKGKWMAGAQLNGRTKFIGRYSLIEDAESAVKKFRAAHGYSPEHGKNRPHYA